MTRNNDEIHDMEDMKNKHVEDSEQDKNVAAETKEQTGTAKEETKEQTETAKEETKSSKKDCKAEKKAALEALEKDLEKVKADLAKEKDDYLRLMAEFDNYRRRTSQEKLDLVSVAALDTIKGLLPILDDCERALQVLESSEDCNEAAKEGTRLIYTKLMTYLKSKGLAEIEALNLPFDTDLHEAVAQFPVPEEERKGKVFDVCQKGYTLNGKVIRFAKVVVGI